MSHKQAAADDIQEFLNLAFREHPELNFVVSVDDPDDDEDPVLLASDEYDYIALRRAHEILSAALDEASVSDTLPFKCPACNTCLGLLDHAHFKDGQPTTFNVLSCNQCRRVFPHPDRTPGTHHPEEPPEAAYPIPREADIPKPDAPVRDKLLRAAVRPVSASLMLQGLSVPEAAALCRVLLAGFERVSPHASSDNVKEAAQKLIDEANTGFNRRDHDVH